MKKHITASTLLVLLACSPTFAQDWAKKMFEVTSHDFGTVARDAKAEFRFVLKNIYREDVHIASVRSSCGCTIPRIEESLLKTYEKGAIVATFNTKAFLGRRGATVSVTIDKPYLAEVQLHVKGHIRGDVILKPESVRLGSIDPGRSVEKRIAVSYSGHSPWKILGVTSPNPHLSADVVETFRRPGGVGYDLIVRLDENAPVGYLNDRLTLLTSDDRTSQISVLVEGRVESAITVRPASLFLGVLHPGQKVSKRLVVQGKKPFRINGITSDDARFQFESPTQTSPKPVHLIPVTFVAGEDLGKVSQTIRIETDLGAAATELLASALVSTE